MLGAYVQTHRKHELGVAETRLMGDLEPTDKLLCATFSHGRQQQLEARAGAEQAKESRKVRRRGHFKGLFLSLTELSEPCGRRLDIPDELSGVSRSDKARSHAAYILPTNCDGGFLDLDRWGCWVWSHSSGRKGELVSLQIFV